MEQVLAMVEKILVHFKEFDAAAVIAIIKDFFTSITSFIK